MKKINIVGILGFKGSGKDTAAQILIDNGYQRFAFGDSLKDVMAKLFSWPREMMEGNTAESRQWRETVDTWWANRLNMPDFTPRIAMTYVGNDILKAFHPDIWIANMEAKLQQTEFENIVITDCRFAGECNLIRQLGGKLLRIDKGPEPEFCRYSNLIGMGGPIEESARDIMKTDYGDIHESEWAWNHIKVDHRISNDGSIPELHQSVMAALSS